MTATALAAGPQPARAAEAFGGPGLASSWAPANNHFVGTARNSTSRIWFTGFDGIVGAVFWPTADTPNTTDLQFMVGDSGGTWVDEERRDTSHAVSLIDSRALAWKVTNTDRDGRYRIEKTIYTDPDRDVLIQEVTFRALTGTVGDFRLYALFNPAISNSGDNDYGQTIVVDGKAMLQSGDGNGRTAVLAATRPFSRLSNGFVGTSDGWTDLNGTGDHTMDWTFGSATGGNIAQMAQVSWGASAGYASASFKLVLGFGASAATARSAVSGTLASSFSTLKSTYRAQWNAWASGLDSLGGTADRQYYVAAMGVKAHQDKDSGALVAGLGNPWGDTQGDWSNGGYHLVWARDLYQKASALLAAGDVATAGAAVDWLFYRQQRPDGSFPQNSWLDGSPYWTGQQLDETAFPIMLALKTGRTGWGFYVNEIRPAAEYLMANGPRTGQERWEENGGYSPSTIAAQIAGLVAAGRIAELNGDGYNRDRYYARADWMHANVERWTFTTSGPYGNGRYYLRIDDDANPNDGHAITVANGGGTWDERSILDAGYLELVRHGVKPAGDAYVLDSLPETDATIKQTIAGRGDYWWRYNHDGYGEKLGGANYDGTGVGRLWPLLTGERGHYEIAAGGDAAPYLAAMRRAANSGYQIPEQVWDLNAPAGQLPGTPTRSMTPLGWSMAEYVSLAISNYRHAIAGQLQAVRDRYAGG